MSLNQQILDRLTPADRLTTGEIAQLLGLETKKVSSAVSKLIKAGKLVRFENGTVGYLTTEEEAAEEPVEAPEAPEADEATPTAEEAVEEPAEELAAAGSKEFNIPAWKRKIAAMLAKAERTDNDAEREAFLEMAERMMLRLGIHRAELEATGETKKEKIVQKTRDWKGNYSIVMVPFVHNVAYGFGGITVLQTTYSAMLRRTYIVGPESQVDEFLRLIDSLALQVMTSLKRYQKETVEERRYMTDMEKYIQHRSFIQGFGQTVSRRLKALREQEETVMSTGAALVVANRDAEVSDWITAQYGELGKSRGGMRVGDYSARSAGQEAGKTATLNQKDIDAGSAAALGSK